MLVTRRRFLQTTASALAAAPALVRGSNLNSKLQVAAIGCDGKGWSDTKQMADHAQVQHVAFCDVDLGRTAKVRELNPEAPVYQDYRLMLEELGDAIDAVTVSTPDHMHATINRAALRLGKHIYCQKPLTHTVREAREMRDMAAQADVITRMGNQIHSHQFYRTAAHAVQSGAVGKVKEVRSWCGTTGHGKSGFMDRPKNPVSPPESVDWDIWIGVAPMRPYGVDRCYHPWGWRDWQDFGNGALGDFGCHILDPVFTALEISGGPTELTADHTGMNDEVWPAQTTVNYTFPGTRFTVGDTLPISWDDGGRLPSVRGSHVSPQTALPSSGSLFIGETGSLVLPHVGEMRVYREGGQLVPNDEFEQLESLNHYHGWVDGCISGEQPSDGFAYAAPLTEAVLLGNVAVRLRGEPLKWDADAFRFTNNEAANGYLSREYRDGWQRG